MISRPCVDEFRDVFFSKEQLDIYYEGMKQEDKQFIDLANRIRKPKTKEDKEYRNIFLSILEKCSLISHYSDIAFYLYDIKDSKIYSELIDILDKNITPINASNFIEEILSRKHTKRETAKFMLDSVLAPICSGVQLVFIEEISKRYKPKTLEEQQNLYCNFFYINNSLAKHPTNTIRLTDGVSAIDILNEVNLILDEMLKDVKENSEEEMYDDYVEFGYFKRITDTYLNSDGIFLLNHIADSSLIEDADPDKREINDILSEYSDEFRPRNERDGMNYDDKYLKLGLILRVLSNHYSSTVEKSK